MDYTTTDLSKFDTYDLQRLEMLLKAMREQGLPDDFHNDQVHVMMNNHSYDIFLTNSDCQVAMMNGDDLENFYTCSNCGEEGFACDITLTDDGCDSCDEESENS